MLALVRWELPLAIVVLIGGTALAYVALREDRGDLPYDEARAIESQAQATRGQLGTPPGFRPITSEAAGGEVDLRLIDVVVDAAAIRVHGRAIDARTVTDPREKPVAEDACSPPLELEHALEWAATLSRAVGAPTDRANVVIDERTPFVVAFAALRWLACEHVTPILVVGDSAGKLGTSDALRDTSRCERDVHVVASGSGYEVSRGTERSPARYGAGCTKAAAGIAVEDLHDTDALSGCLARALGDAEGELRDTVRCVDVVGPPQTPFGDVARVMLVSRGIAPVILAAPRPGPP
jgi:hypothetical protein